jgi:hypothetical protein
MNAVKGAGLQRKGQCVGTWGRGGGDKSITFVIVSLFYNATEYRTFRQHKMSVYYYSDATAVSLLLYIQHTKRPIAS